MLRMTLVSIGKLKDAEERALFTRYQDRISATGGSLGFSKLEIREFAESRGKNPALRKEQEANDIVKATAGAEYKVALDERGKDMTSRAFASWLGNLRDDGVGQVAFVIGGPDGHDDSIRKATNKCLSLSRLTLPHGLARILFVEQLYRALTILGNHPYHRD